MAERMSILDSLSVPRSWTIPQQNISNLFVDEINSGVSTFLSDMNFPSTILQKAAALNPGVYAICVVPMATKANQLWFAKFITVGFLFDDEILEKSEAVDKVSPIVQAIRGDIMTDPAIMHFLNAMHSLAIDLEKISGVPTIRTNLADVMQKFVESGIKCNRGAKHTRNLPFEQIVSIRSVDCGGAIVMLLNEQIMCETKNGEVDGVDNLQDYDELRDDICKLLAYHNDIVSLPKDTEEKHSVNIVISFAEKTMLENIFVARNRILESTIPELTKKFDRKATNFLEIRFLSNLQRSWFTDMLNMMKWMISGTLMWSQVIPRYSKSGLMSNSTA